MFNQLIILVSTDLKQRRGQVATWSTRHQLRRERSSKLRPKQAAVEVISPALFQATLWYLSFFPINFSIIGYLMSWKLRCNVMIASWALHVIGQTTLGLPGFTGVIRRKWCCCLFMSGFSLCFANLDTADDGLYRELVCCTLKVGIRYIIIDLFGRDSVH